MNNKSLFLTLETFSQTGGIQKVCRTMAKALQDITGTLTLFSLCDANKDLMENYVHRDNFKGFAGKKNSFAILSIFAGFKHQIIVLAHINLLPIAYVLKCFSPSKRIILLAHGIEVWRTLTPFQQRFINKNIEIWAVSEFTRDKMISINKVNPGNIKVLLNCLDPFFSVPSPISKPPSLLERYNITNEDPILLTVCRLSEFEHQKGYDRIIDCLHLLLTDHPTLKYMIVGPYDQNEKRRLESAIDKSNLRQHIFIVGFVPEDELCNYFLLADVFILPSQKEGFGLVLIEAAACGCKVIGGNKDGSIEALLNGKLGVLVDPESTEQILYALTSALKPTALPHSERTQKLALDSFSFSNYRNQVNKLIA